MCLPKFDIYQGTIAPNCFKSHNTPEILIFFKKVLSDIRSEIHLVRRNIVSNGQFDRDLKKIMFRPDNMPKK